MSIPTDDRPFLYLRTRGIPSISLNVMIALGLLIVLFALYLQRTANGPKPGSCWERSMGWFTEGFETADLQEAKALLAALE